MVIDSSICCWSRLEYHLSCWSENRGPLQLAFTPRPGKLPVRRRLDRALNKSRGEIWIDQDTFEVARLTFELTDRVRLWWGILGSVSNVTGRVERRPIAENVWMPDEIDVYYEYRVLFSNSGRGGTTRWSDFTAIGE
jgi:hypothetical protein